MDVNTNVCIIDDDDIYQLTTSINIKAINPDFKINLFNDGLEAINFIKANLTNQTELPDIIFLDINMPVMDGFQFMEEYVLLKPQLNKPITIHMVSSSVDPVDTEKSKLHNEISEYIVKPLKKPKLEEILKCFIDNSNA
ncbi:response regulator [Aurantibacter sp.]|uniref:response regulator n=1 Tax=Aurantibacter sp. TaxID=2807103 RepID=UPI0032678EB4